ncbi:MAG: T9SS type A sorting domain-containing protein [Saprospiraceae bacterium]
MIKFISPVLVAFLLNSLQAQTIQFQFCGKTEYILPTIDPNTGKDQRTNAYLKLDFLKIGVRGGSQSAPFYVLGNVEAVAVNDNFKDLVIADNCASSGGSTGDCKQCGTCNDVLSTTNANIGTAIGKFLSNVRVESKGNDLYIMSTGKDNVVCYETYKISLAGKGNKKLDVYYKYEGVSKNDASLLKNISLNYRFNNEAYFGTPYFFNKNSGHIGVFEDVGSIFASVPVATEDLSKKLKFEISPNPVKESLNLNLSVFQKFDGFINLLNASGSVVYFEPISFEPSVSTKEINVSNLPAGNYIVHVSDDDGRLSVLKFQKL